MTQSIKLSVAGIAFAVALLFGATYASAAVTLQDFGFRVNDKSSDTIKAGDSVKVTVNLDVNGGDELEYLRARFINTNGDIIVNHCEKVGRIADVSDRNVSFDVDTASDMPEGRYDVQVTPFGIPGEAQSLPCDLDNDYAGAETYEDRLFVDTDGDGEVGGGSTMSALEAMIAQLTAAIAKLTAGGSTTPTSAKCTEIATKMAGGVQGVNAPGNVALQGYLLSEGASIPALAAGAAFGFWGPQTSAAISWFKSIHKCV